MVDGIIGGNFDPNDVETITVMKDAGATALYGSQANGGVIVVTTKKAKTGKPQFEVKAVGGVRIADHGHVKMMDSKTLYNYHREYFRDPVLFEIDLNIKLTDWLSFSSTNRLSANTFMDKQYYSATADNLSYYGTGFVSSRSDLNYGGITTNLLKFQFAKGGQSLNGLIGFEAGGDHSDYIQGSGTGIPEGLKVPTVASGQYSIEGAPVNSVMQSLISQINYTIKNKYFFSGSFRVDQSSSFAPNKRTALFPSLSAAWNISNEDFMESVKSVNNLRLKFSWGKTRMKDIGPYKYMEQFRYATQYNGLPAAIPYQMANPDLTWEQTDQFNLGMELGLFQRINLDLNVYKNITSNLLVYRDLPPSGGFRKQWQNIGKSENTGVELGISSINIKSADFTWTTDVTIGFNKNRLSGFGSDTIQNANAYGIVQIYHNGGTLYSWYAKEYYGIDPDNGSMLWVGTDGKPTHDYQAARKIEYGSPMPKIQGGFGTELKYRSLALRANFSFVSGNKIYNYFRRYVDHDLQDVGFNVMMPRDDWKIWQHPGDIANHPLPQNAINSYDPSTRFIEDGSYIKVRNVTMSYELPSSFVSKLKLTGVTLSVGADNLYTFTDFWGQDLVRNYWGYHLDSYNGIPTGSEPGLSASGVLIHPNDVSAVYPIPSSEISTNKFCVANN